MTTTDPFAQFKAVQKEFWAFFAPLEVLTTPPAGLLVDFARVEAKEKVLDVACGTGVVSVTAARRGAHAKGLDLSPVLLTRARENATIAGVEIEFTEGDAEKLPYPDATFDTVLSQFGHMFAPRPAVVIGEMLRVLKPGGKIAFSTWPPELFTGKMFALVAKYLPPPEGVAPPPQWGDPNVVRERLGDKVKDLVFHREVMVAPALSARHFMANFEKTAGPVAKLVESLKDDPARLKQFRTELEALVTIYMRGNTVQQQFLMSRARKI